VNLRGLLATALLAAGVTVFAPAAPADASVHSSVCAFAPTSSGVTVAVVVDFGDGSPASAVCVPAGSSDNGAAVLAARAQQLGTPAPRFDSSGFVCGIDGYPSSGCGEQSGSTYAYWSYWHGSGSWEYSNVGPGGSRVHAEVVEGWRFQPQGAGNPTDPPPNASPDHNATCVPATTTTAAAAPGTTVVAPAIADTTSTGPAAPAAIDASTTTAGASTSTTTTATTTTSIPTASRSQVAAAPVRVTDKRGGGSSPWPAIGAGVVIVGLVGGGVYASRRRGAPP